MFKIGAAAESFANSFQRLALAIEKSLRPLITSQMAKEAQSQEDRVFWKDCVTAVLRAGRPIDAALREANRAVQTLEGRRSE